MLAPVWEKSSVPPTWPFVTMDALKPALSAVVVIPVSEVEVCVIGTALTVRV